MVLVNVSYFKQSYDWLSMFKSQCKLLWSSKDQPRSASVFQSMIWERVNPPYPLTGGQQIRVSQGLEGLGCRCLVKEALLGCISVLAREFQSDSTWERMKEEVKNALIRSHLMLFTWTPFAHPLAIQTASVWFVLQSAVVALVCVCCLGVDHMVYCTTPKGPYCLSFPSVGAVACVYCKTCHHPLFCLIDGIIR